jgi:hypothetical protein
MISDICKFFKIASFSSKGRNKGGVILGLALTLPLLKISRNRLLLITVFENNLDAYTSLVNILVLHIFES